MKFMIFFDMIQTIAFAAFLLFIGIHLCKRVSFLNKYNIPAPVVGGLIFAFVNWGLQYLEIGLRFDNTLQDPLMIGFFTTIGLAANIKMLKEGGVKLIIFLGVAALLLVLQNLVAWGLSIVTGINPILGLLAGSITMSGGHGTGATFANFFTEQFHVAGAMELSMAAATFGLVAGSLIGGPIARRLIIKKNLKPVKDGDAASSDTAVLESITDEIANIENEPIGQNDVLATIFQIALAMGIGSVIYGIFLQHDLMVPTYLFSLFVGIIIRNLAEMTGWYKVNARLVDMMGSVCLSIFLAMALMSLQLWQLVEMAGPMLAILGGEMLLMIFFAYFVTFYLNGADYQAAVLAGGHCGFGLGATPNAIANMQAITDKYGPAPRAYFIISIIGAFFIDILNAMVIQFFVTLIQ
jgi:ESS family glutamate:Na+ symporter